MAIMNYPCRSCGNTDSFAFAERWGDKSWGYTYCRKCLRKVGDEDLPTDRFPSRPRLINQGETMRQAAPSAIAPAQEKAAKEILANVNNLFAKKPKMTSYSSSQQNQHNYQTGRDFLATIDSVQLQLDDGTRIGITITSPDA